LDRIPGRCRPAPDRRGAGTITIDTWSRRRSVRGWRRPVHFEDIGVGQLGNASQVQPEASEQDLGRLGHVVGGDQTLPQRIDELLLAAPQLI